MPKMPPKTKQKTVIKKACANLRCVGAPGVNDTYQTRARFAKSSSGETCSRCQRISNLHNHGILLEHNIWEIDILQNILGQKLFYIISNGA